MNELVKPQIESATGLMEKAISHLESELAKIRAGKASAQMLDGIYIDYYGNNTPLNQVANINTPDARTIAIQPWEKPMLQAIEKGIIISNLGFNPTNDGTVIRVVLPPLTEERRKEIVKKVKGESENAKVAIRNIRKDINEQVKKLQKDGLAEDEAKSAEQQVQKTTDTFIKKIDDLTAAKEAEVMHV